MVICLERGADLHMVQMVSCFSKIQIGFTFLVPAHPGSPGQRAVKRVCVHLLADVLMQAGHTPVQVVPPRCDTLLPCPSALVQPWSAGRGSQATNGTSRLGLSVPQHYTRNDGRRRGQRTAGNAAGWTIATCPYCAVMLNSFFFGCPHLRFGLLAVCLHMLLLLLINVQI